MSKKQAPKHYHLIPLLSFVPILMTLLLTTSYSIQFTSFWAAIVSLAYVATNIIYRHVRSTLQISSIIEYVLIALLVYVVLVEYA